jgi:GT2 family glycosyltransferase
VSRANNARGARAVGPGLSVVVSTYDWPEALDATLRALSEQSDPRFDVVVADDGSGRSTSAVIEDWRRVFGTRLRHVWQPDEGFRLALARNRGAADARSDYLVFLDGDCIPRRRFVSALLRCARPGWFVAGRRVELSRALTANVLSTAEPVHRWSSARWFGARAAADGLSALTPRDRRRVGARGVPEFEPHDRAYGFLVGLRRADFERVNGYDTRYVGWGEEDVDLAMRLRRLGLRCGHAGAPATVVHLWHPPRPDPDRSNGEMLSEVQDSAEVEAVLGLRELQPLQAWGAPSYQTATIDG